MLAWHALHAAGGQAEHRPGCQAACLGARGLPPHAHFVSATSAALPPACPALPLPVCRHLGQTVRVNEHSAKAFRKQIGQYVDSNNRWVLWGCGV